MLFLICSYVTSNIAERFLHRSLIKKYLVQTWKHTWLLFLDLTRERGLTFLINRISLKRLVTLKQSWFGLKTWFLNDNTILFLFTIIEIHNKRFRIDSRQNRPRVGGDGQTTNKVILRFIKGKNFEEWNLNSFKNSRKFDSSPGMPIFVDLGLIVSPATSSGENQC